MKNGFLWLSLNLENERSECSSVVECNEPGHIKAQMRKQHSIGRIWEEIQGIRSWNER